MKQLMEFAAVADQIGQSKRGSAEEFARATGRALVYMKEDGTLLNEDGSTVNSVDHTTIVIPYGE